MRKISVVIGANYGDEGKGLVTDYLAYQSPSMVVRFNGGAQAGHTVVTPGGLRHVFHHFGAGTFTGSPTYLSKYFAVSPMFFHSEYLKLKGHGLDPIVFIDPRCVVTTPYDIMLNQAIEASRGVLKYGSCGMGFGETLERCNGQSAFRLTVEDCMDGGVFQILDEIRNIWIPFRANQMKCKVDESLLKDDMILAKFMLDIQQMLSHCTVGFLQDIVADFDLIFEGAQGLLLDQDHHNFPHVTRSKTGKKNALKIISDESLFGDTTFYYVSRTYLTRHGAGPMSYEIVRPIGEDLTNVYNEHQGDLRYAYIDKDSLENRISSERSTDEDSIFVLTCADQTPTMTYLEKGMHKNSVPSLFASLLRLHTGCRDYLVSHGPTRADIRLP